MSSSSSRTSTSLRTREIMRNLLITCWQVLNLTVVQCIVCSSFFFNLETHIKLHWTVLSRQFEYSIYSAKCLEEGKSHVCTNLPSPYLTGWEEGHPLRKWWIEPSPPRKPTATGTTTWFWETSLWELLASEVPWRHRSNLSCMTSQNIKVIFLASQTCINMPYSLKLAFSTCGNWTGMSWKHWLMPLRWWRTRMAGS